MIHDMNEDDLHLRRIRKGGQEVFFQYKNEAGRRLYFELKKGGTNFFWREKGAKREKMGLRFFTGSKFPKPGLGTRQSLVGHLTSNRKTIS